MLENEINCNCDYFVDDILIAIDDDIKDDKFRKDIFETLLNAVDSSSFVNFLKVKIPDGCENDYEAVKSYDIDTHDNIVSMRVDVEFDVKAFIKTAEEQFCRIDLRSDEENAEKIAEEQFDYLRMNNYKIVELTKQKGIYVPVDEYDYVLDILKEHQSQENNFDIFARDTINNIRFVRVANDKEEVIDDREVEEMER